MVVHSSWTDLSDWLMAAYPRDIPIPIPKGQKHPAFQYADNKWTWEKFYNYKPKANENIAILLRDICVIDIDSKELVTEFEAKFPVLKTCPCENTTKGRHYFFSRTTKTDTYGYYDQRSGRVPLIDFKTVCSTGNPGVIVVTPSEGKTWIHAPWTLGDVLPNIPDDLLDAVAHPVYTTNNTPTICLTFEQTGESYTTQSRYLHKFEVIRQFLPGEDEKLSDEEITIPILVGKAEDLCELLYICENRQVSKWSVDLTAVRKMADYLCCSTDVHRLLMVKNPASPLSWFLSVYTVLGAEWAHVEFFNENDETLIDVTSQDIRYIPPVKNYQAWLFPKTACISVLKPGDRVLRENIAAFCQVMMPDVVNNILYRFNQTTILAGGAALWLTSHATGTPSDYDIYMCTPDPEHAKEVIAYIASRSDVTVTAQTGCAVTFLVDNGNDNHIVVQVILRCFVNIQHVFKSFDIGPCKVAVGYLGTNSLQVVASKNWLQCMTYMSFCVDFHQWNPASVPRIFKYYAKGFEVFVPAMDPSMFLKAPKYEPGIANLIFIEKAFYTNYYINHRHRPDKDLITSLVRTYNYWGLRHQSAYEEYVGSGFQYVVLSIINQGFKWLGLRPIGRMTSTPQTQLDVNSLEIPIAGYKCFHSSKPNFSGLYKFP